MRARLRMASARPRSRQGELENDNEDNVWFERNAGADCRLRPCWTSRVVERSHSLGEFSVFHAHESVIH